MKKFKKPICLILSILLLMSPLFSLSSFADEEEDNKAELEQQLNKELKENEGYKDTLTTLDTVYKDKEGANYTIPADRMGATKNLSYIMWRVFRSDYMYDVSTFSPPKLEEDEMNLFDLREISKTGKQATICNKKRDGQFLYHNCDIPTVIRSAFQNLQTLTNDKPLEGAEKTTAYEENLGIPAKIPGGEVPLNPAGSSNKYTGLELFGYDLKHTSYNGEWDNVQVNTSARLLSNYGILDKIKLGGKSLVEGTKSVLADFLNVRSLDDLKKTVFSIPSRFVGGTITTLLDTSDANVAATRAWGRPDFAQTVYNGVHYLPNKLVATRALSAYADFLVANFEKEAKKNKELKPWLDYMVDKLPEYNAEDYPIYKNQEEYDKYQKDLKKYNKYKKCKDEGGKICGFKRSKPKKVKLKKYTKEERFDLYKNNEDVQKFMTEAEALGIENVLNKKGVKDFASLRKEYGKAFTTGIKKKFAEGSKAVKDIGESLARKFYNQYPQYDVKKEISHWVCTGNDNPSLKTLVDAPYLFTSEYHSKINPECGDVKLRKTIKGGNNGSGDTAKDKIADTRWKQFMATKEEGVIRKAINSGGFIDGLNKFFVKLTNTLLSFSFDSVITQSGLDKIVVPFVKELRDGMYYPLISIALAATGLWMFYTFAIKNFSPGNFLKYTLSLLLVFLFILFFLDRPEKTINIVETVPSTMDNLILDAVYGKNDDNVDNQLCTVQGNKIRSIQCEVWQIGIFNPWLMGQFGTTKLSDLNEKNMKNTNKDLIGSPKVDFGAGKTMNNWALYQLKLTKSGTITTKDTKENSKENTYTENSIDNNMFKLVDLQFGPNNAKGRDTRFASQWASRSGKNGAGLLGVVVSFVMLLILGKFLVYKIQLSLSMFLQIMLLPFFALVGMLPNGVNRMKDFGMNFIGLFLKRITVTLFTAILLKMLLAGANSGIVGIPYYIYVISVLLSFNILWKDYAALIASDIETPFKGNSAGSNLLSGDYVDMKSAKTALAQANLAPRSVDQYLETKKEKLEARTSGAIAGGLIAMKTYNSRKNQMITVEKKSIEKDKDGNYYIATRTEQKKESAFDVIKEISSEGAKKTDNWMYKKHRREGFGLLTQVINSQEKLDRELVTSITSGGRTADEASANLAYTRLRTLGKQRGFDLTPDDVANSVSLQRHIRQYAREMDKREIALKYKPETEEDLNSNMQSLIESDERMKTLLNSIEKDVANAKKLTPENINAKKLAQLNAIQSKNVEYRESYQYKEEVKENYKQIFYNIQLLKEKENLQNDYLGKKVGLTEEEAEKLLTNSLTQRDLDSNDNLRRKHEKLVKQGIADPIDNTEKVDKDKIVNIEFKEVRKRDLHPGEIKKAFEDYQKENNLTRDLSQEEMTKIIEDLKKKTLGKKAINPNKEQKEKLDIKITTYGDLLNKRTTNNSEGYDAILDFYKKELTELGLSEEISKIEKEVKNDIKDNYRRKLEVPNEK